MKKRNIVPKEAKVHIKYLDSYKVNENLQTCDLLHLYDTGVYGCGKNGDSVGYVDSKLFNVWCFDFDKKEKRKLEGRDQIDFYSVADGVQMIRIFADGSTLIKLKRKLNIGWGQSLSLEEIEP